MLVTAGQSGLTWTVTRGNNLASPDTTTNATHANNATVTHILTAGGLTNYTLNPVSGASWAASTLLTLGSIANNYGLVINGPSGAGTSFGIKTVAGTNSTDYAARFQTQAAVDVLAARGDGVVVIGGAPAQLNMTGVGQAKVVGGTTGGVVQNNANSAANLSWTDAGLLTLRNGILIPRDAANNVLAPNSAYATVPVKIDDQVLAVAASTVTFAPNPLPTTFRHLLIEWYARGDTAATATGIYIRFNNVSTNTYDYQYVRGNAVTASAAETLTQAQAQIGDMTAASATANYFGMGTVHIPHYQGTTGNKIAVGNCVLAISDASASGFSEQYLAKWRTTATAITRIDLVTSAGNFAAGSIFTLWGLP